MDPKVVKFKMWISWEYLALHGTNLGGIIWNIVKPFGLKIRNQMLGHVFLNSCMLNPITHNPNYYIKFSSEGHLGDLFLTIAPKSDCGPKNPALTQGCAHHDGSHGSAAAFAFALALGSFFAGGS